MTPGAPTFPSPAGSPTLRRSAATAASPPLRRAGWLAAAAIACGALGVLGLDLAWPGPLTRMMGTHILLMNVVAPLVALAVAALRRESVEALSSALSLATATLLQLALLAALHLPAVLETAATTPLIHLLLQAALLVVALWFWLAVVATRGARRWRSLVALAFTAKLFCLLAALLVFAPRLIAAGLAQAHTGHPSPATLADQQLAGILMLAACPLTYVLAGLIIAQRWLAEIAAGVAGRGRPDAATMHAA